MARQVNAAKHAAKRQHILDSAAHLFAEQGYERTTTAQLCSQAGISLGTLYHYFGSKMEVFLGVLTQDKQDDRELLEAFANRDDAQDALLEFIEHLAQPATAHPIVPKLVLEAIIQAGRDAEVLAALETADADEQRGIQLLLKRAIDAGQADPLLNIEEAAAWLSTLVGALYLDAATKAEYDPARQIHQLLRTARAYVQPYQP